MQNYDYSQPYVTRDEYLEVKGVDLNIELQDDDNSSNKVNRFIQDITNFVLDHLVMEYNCNELNREFNNFEDLAEFRRKRFHYGMLDQIEYVLNNGLIQLDSGINRETGAIMDLSGLVIGPSALKQFRLGGFCNKQESSTKGGSLSPREMPTIEELLLLVSKKVDKVDGKGLSSNDFTTAYKLLVDSLAREIDNKVDKVVGKVLTDNNFTNALLQKLLGIEAGAQVNKIEEIRVDNEPVTISGKVVNLTSFVHDETKEDVANKVTTISSESTDAQYPTAKCVYDNLQTVLEVALGSTKAFSVNPETTGNETFQSDNATITVTSFVDVNGNEVDVSTLKKGDLVFTLNGENVRYADRWLIDPATGAWGLIDADTPNLEGYVTTNTAQTITAVKTIALNNEIAFGSISAFQAKNNGIDIKIRTYAYAIRENAFLPMLNNDLGSFSLPWKDLHLTGKIKDGTNEFNYSTIGFPRIATPSSTTLTNDEKANIRKGCIIENFNLGGTQWQKCTFYPSGDLFSGYYMGTLIIQRNGYYRLVQYAINDSNNLLTIYGNKYIDIDSETNISIAGLNEINNKAIDHYLNNVYPYATNSTTELQYETINDISVSADTTFTLAAAPANTYPEYKANITNSGASAINLTFPSGTVIKTNDSNITIASNVLTLPAGTTIEVNIQNGKMIAFNWDFGNAVQLISFSINGITYQAEEGMTWAEWVDSEYNTDGYYVDDDRIYSSPNTYIYDSEAENEGPNVAPGRAAEPTDEITDEAEYSLVNVGGGGSND